MKYLKTFTYKFFLEKIIKQSKQLKKLKINICKTNTFLTSLNGYSRYNLLESYIMFRTWVSYLLTHKLI